MARTCGAHQGAGATLTCFEASGGLRSANEERGETRDEDEDEVRRRRGSRGEASDDGAARTKASWWRWYHVRQSRSRARAAGHGVGFRAQRSDYPYRPLMYNLQFRAQSVIVKSISSTLYFLYKPINQYLNQHHLLISKPLCASHGWDHQEVNLGVGTTEGDLSNISSCIALGGIWTVQ